MGFSHLQQKTGFVLMSEQEGRAVPNYMTLVDKNGLIQVVPRPKARAMSFVPLKLIAMFVALVMVFKALALLSVGVLAYEEELAALAAGNIFEQAGGVILWIDPITEVIYATVAPLMK